MLHMFSETCCKCLFKMFHPFPNVCCNRFLFGCCICITHVLQKYVPKCFSCFSLMLQQVVSCCKLLVLYFGCFMCSTHMLQVYVLNISFVFQTYVAFKCFFSCCKCFMLFGRGWSRGQADGASGTPGGLQTGALGADGECSDRERAGSHL